MPQAWFVVPYDHVDPPVPGGSPARACSMKRYIPATPGPEGERWDEAECLGNFAVVKVDAPDSMMTTLRAEADFLEIPTGAGMIPIVRRAAIQAFLILRGYTLEEILSVAWSSTGLLNLLTQSASVLQIGNARRIEPTASRRPAPKTVADIEARLPSPIR